MYVSQSSTHAEQPQWNATTKSSPARTPVATTTSKRLRTGARLHWDRVWQCTLPRGTAEQKIHPHETEDRHGTTYHQDTVRNNNNNKIKCTAIRTDIILPAAHPRTAHPYTPIYERDPKRKRGTRTYVQVSACALLNANQKMYIYSKIHQHGTRSMHESTDRQCTRNKLTTKRMHQKQCDNENHRLDPEREPRCNRNTTHCHVQQRQ